MKDTFMQTVGIRTGYGTFAESHVTQELIRKFTPEQMDRLLKISPHREKEHDLHW